MDRGRPTKIGRWNPGGENYREVISGL